MTCSDKLRLLSVSAVRSVSIAAVCGATLTTWSVAQETGVAHPDEAVIETTEAPAVVVQSKPSAATPMPGTATATENGSAAYGAYVPYTGARAAAMPAPTAMTAEEADGAVVMSVADQPDQLREGTLLQTRLRERLSTAATTDGAATEEGQPFSAELVTPVENEGRVVLPIGTVIRGQVTSVHGGRRISGAAALHLEAREITLPDGTRYHAHLQLIDTDQLDHTKVDSEGSLVRRDRTKETAAELGVPVGTGAVAGAAIGGPVGLGVGAGIGAGVGTVLWLKQDRQEVVPAHSLLVFSLSEALPLTKHGETPAVAEAHAAKVSGNPDGMVVGVDQ